MERSIDDAYEYAQEQLKIATEVLGQNTDNLTLVGSEWQMIAEVAERLSGHITQQLEKIPVGQDTSVRQMLRWYAHEQCELIASALRRIGNGGQSNVSVAVTDEQIATLWKREKGATH